MIVIYAKSAVVRRLASPDASLWRRMTPSHCFMIELFEALAWHISCKTMCSDETSKKAIRSKKTIHYYISPNGYYAVAVYARNGPVKEVV